MSPDLRRLLRATSRSFYLSLVTLPRATRGAIGLAYLLARAADTVADTALVPAALRLALLERLAAGFRAGLGPDAALADEVRRVVRPAAAAGAGAGAGCASDGSAGEVRLLERLEEAGSGLSGLSPGDRERVARVLATIVEGMALDLRWFPEGEARRADPPALGSADDLDRYCFHVAGSVGAFWTEMHVAHGWRLGEAARARALDLGARYGKGLQRLNIARDLPRDLDRGRCYLPADALAAAGLAPAQLRDPARAEAALPLLRGLLADAAAGLEAGRAYLRLLPAWAPRLRLATALPLALGIRTLARLEQAGARLLDRGTTVKVPRAEVYRLLFGAAARALSPRALDRWLARLSREAAR